MEATAHLWKVRWWARSSRASPGTEWYLHIGHAKAVLLVTMQGGTVVDYCQIRRHEPSKEKGEYADNILKIVTLGWTSSG